jgi:hypothetical protein
LKEKEESFLYAFQILVFGCLSAWCGEELDDRMMKMVVREGLM